jgi:hypothetical protein
MMYDTSGEWNGVADSNHGSALTRSGRRVKRMKVEWHDGVTPPASGQSGSCRPGEL